MIHGLARLHAEYALLKRGVTLNGSNCEQRFKLARRLFRFAQDAEEGGRFDEAVKAYWLAFSLSNLYAANQRLHHQKHLFIGSEQLLVATNAMEHFYNGLRYFAGIGVRQDLIKAQTCFQSAASQGVLIATTYLGIVQIRQQQPSAAEATLKSVAESNEPYAQYLLARHLQSTNPAQAKKYYSAAADQMWASAIYRLAIITGEQRFFRQAAELGLPKALCHRVIQLYQGSGVPITSFYPRVATLLQTIAVQKDPQALVMVGEFYRATVLFWRELNGLYAIYEKAAELKDHTAKLVLACAHLCGWWEKKIDLDKLDQLLFGLHPAHFLNEIQSKRLTSTTEFRQMVLQLTLYCVSRRSYLEQAYLLMESAMHLLYMSDYNGAINYLTRIEERTDSRLHRLYYIAAQTMLLSICIKQRDLEKCLEIKHKLSQHLLQLEDESDSELESKLQYFVLNVLKDITGTSMSLKSYGEKFIAEHSINKKFLVLYQYIMQYSYHGNYLYFNEQLQTLQKQAFQIANASQDSWQIKCQRLQDALSATIHRCFSAFEANKATMGLLFSRLNLSEDRVWLEGLAHLKPAVTVDSAPSAAKIC